MSIYAVDGAGNRSQTVKIDNPTYAPDGKADGKEAGKPASASMDKEQEPVMAKNPMTPDGQEAVLDIATQDEGKEFYTLETRQEISFIWLWISRGIPITCTS